MPRYAGMNGSPFFGMLTCGDNKAAAVLFSPADALGCAILLFGWRGRNVTNGSDGIRRTPLLLLYVDKTA